MKSIRHESLKYTIDFRHPPVLEVEQGEPFTLETEDAPSGTYRTSDDAARLLDVWYLRHSPPMANPVTGPVYIKGVKPGDTLVVHIDRLDLDAQGVTYWRPGHKPLGDSLKWHDLSKPTLVIGRIENGEVLMAEAATWENGKVNRHPLALRVRQAPFIGTIAVAPEREVETTGMGQGSWGGNMDVRDMCPGSRVLFPCYHEGGLLYVGDVHACQGDTEIYGTAMEIRSTVTLRCHVIKQKRVPFVRLDKDTSIISLACSIWRPLTGEDSGLRVYLGVYSAQTAPTSPNPPGSFPAGTPRSLTYVTQGSLVPPGRGTPTEKCHTHRWASHISGAEWGQ